MSQIQAQRQMRVVTVERPTAWIVVAFLVENQDGREVIVSEPKIIKVRPKKLYALQSGSTNPSQCALSAPVCAKKIVSRLVKSPYIEFFNNKKTQNFSLFARPPTRV